MVANPVLQQAGFTCRGQFRHLPKDYVKRLSKDQTTPYIDSAVMEVLRFQGIRVSGLKPANLYEADQMYLKLAKYMVNSDRVINRWDPNIQYGFSQAFAAFARKKSEPFLKPLSLDGIVKSMKVEKSAGAGYIGPKGLNLERGLTRMKDVLERRKAPNPVLAFTRTSAGNKTRLVWGYPLEMTMMESRFAQPLISQFLGSNTPMAIGRSKFSLAADINFRVCFPEEGEKVFALDYSGFDSTISAGFIDMAFEILSTWFKPQHREQFGWSRIIDYFKRTPIVMPDGNLYTGKKCGVPSGSYFTQMIDSIVNVILIYTMSRKLGFDLPGSRVLVVGDDSIFQASEDLTLKDLEKGLLDYGIKLNVEKSLVGRKHFCGANWDTGFPDIPLEEILVKTVCPERPRFQLYKNLNNQERFQAGLSILYSYARSYASAFTLCDIYKANNKATVVHEAMKDFDFSHIGGLDRARLESDPGYHLVLAKSSLYTGLFI